MKKRIMLIILWIIGIAAAITVVFFIVSTILAYRPEQQEVVFKNDGKSDTLPDSLTIMSWNIGYGGLGDNMDFFYDGGKRVRDTRERTEANLAAIISEMKQCNADIYLLQEVDVHSLRSYNIDQLEMLKKEFPDYHAYFAPNYKSWFVPIPISEPIGRVHSGLVVLTKYLPDSVIRHQYPSSHPYPVSLFNLRRCLMTILFQTRDGKSIQIGNTHSSAFDNGGMRAQEIDYLDDYICKWKASNIQYIIGGDWNQYPPQYTPQKAELENKYYTPLMVMSEDLDQHGRFIFDSSVKSVRFNDFPYTSTSTTSIVDFFYIDNSFEETSVKTLDLNFNSSDHNPTILTITFE